MRRILKDNRMQPSMGAIAILLYALYGAYISSLYILQGDKGGIRSDDFFLFVIVFLLLCLSNLSRLLIKKTTGGYENLLVVLFLMYMMISLLLVARATNRIPFIDIGKYFVVGFVAFSVFDSGWPPVSIIIKKAQSNNVLRPAAISGTMIFLGCIIYFLKKYSGLSLPYVLQFRALANDYYQVFGDFISIAFCCLAVLQISYFKGNLYSNRKFAILMLIILVEAAVCFVCLQMVNSNKSVLIIILISASTIILCKPNKWLVSRSGVRIKALASIVIILIMGVFIFKFLSAIDVTQLRIFDYDQSRSIITNSSLLARWQQIEVSLLDQLQTAPIIGDPSISNYMHSSLLSIQTHLGIVGSLLFWSFIIIKLRRIYRNGGNEILKAIALPILLVSIISSFFSWGPLWFLVGALYAHTPRAQRGFYEAHDKSSVGTVSKARIARQ